GAIESWEEIGTGGILNPSTDRWYDNTDIDDDGPTGGVIGSMSGPNVGFGVGGSTLSQILSTEVASEGEYLLEVAIGDRNIGNNATQFGGYNLELWDGDSQLATTGDIFSSPSGEGSFDDATLSYTAQAGDSGFLEIRLSTLNGGAGVDFDNVRLSVSF
ncbi:unnamed protein product, partial [Ectocarpus fasciculatus]